MSELTETLPFDELMDRLHKTAEMEALTGVNRLTFEEYQSLSAIATHLDDLKNPTTPE